MARRTNISVKDILASKVGHLNQHLAPLAAGGKKQNKYGNQIAHVDGQRFDSKREAARYGLLVLRRKAGEIGLIERQVKYELNPGGGFSYIYIADFRYKVIQTGETVVEDCKGHRTKEYKRKRRLMLKVHGIKILET